MNEKIAINIALLLPKEINDFCKELNQNSDLRTYISFNDGYIPHITLAMGSILVKDLDLLKKDISFVSQDSKGFKIELTSFGVGTFSHINLKLEKEHIKLHEEVCNILDQYNTGDVLEESFFEKQASEILIGRVNHYKKKTVLIKITIHT